ncbi:hypothetical protein [Alkalicoccus luteus]|uniref:hypothetical protein n=1 Tax=Alkalicoccus luteus TaxID=1237094 RepID=UPI00403393E3
MTLRVCNQLLGMSWLLLLVVALLTGQRSGLLGQLLLYTVPLLFLLLGVAELRSRKSVLGYLYLGAAAAGGTAMVV